MTFSGISAILLCLALLAVGFVAGYLAGERPHGHEDHDDDEIS